MKLLMEKWNGFLEESLGAPSRGFDIKLPRLQITKNWGNPDHIDRKTLNLFFSKIAGDTLEQKISEINSLVNNDGGGLEIPQILAKLVFLETLSALVSDFSPQSGGRLFESFIAAIMDIKQEGGTRQIEDVVSKDGRIISLKLLFSDSAGGISGSVANLKRAEKNIGGSGVPYVVAIKNRNSKEGEVMSIDFYFFTIGSEEGNYHADFDVEDFPAMKKSRWGYREEDDTKFQIPVSALQNIDIEKLTLHISKKDILEVSQKYANQLGDNLIKIYQQIHHLSENVNKYFLENDPLSAWAAKNNAEALKKETEKF